MTQIGVNDVYTSASRSKAVRCDLRQGILKESHLDGENDVCVASFAGVGPNEAGIVQRAYTIRVILDTAMMHSNVVNPDVITDTDKRP